MQILGPSPHRSTKSQSISEHTHQVFHVHNKFGRVGLPFPLLMKNKQNSSLGILSLCFAEGPGATASTGQRTSFLDSPLGRSAMQSLLLCLLSLTDTDAESCGRIKMLPPTPQEGRASLLDPLKLQVHPKRSQATMQRVNIEK